MSKHQWDDLILFVEQLSSATQLNLPMDQSIRAISVEALDRKWQDAQVSVSEQVGLGAPLSEAMSNYPQYFPGPIRRLVRAGEEGQVLPYMLRAAGRYLESAREVQNRLQKCLIYPFLVWTILMLDVAVLLLFGVPRLTEMYQSSHYPLPYSTTQFLEYGPLVIFFGVGLLFFLAWLLIGFIGAEAERHWNRPSWLDGLLDYTPFLSALHRHARTSQVCDILGALIRGGRSGREAVAIAREAITSRSLLIALDDVDTAITAGRDYLPGERRTLIPQATLWMLAQTNGAPELGTALENMADFHRRQLDIASTLVREILEPILLIAVAAAGAFAIISLYTPIFNLSNVIF